MSHLENILGAFALTISDRLNKRVLGTSHCSEGGVIALNQIGTRERPTIEDLRASLDVDTHSAATRVIARLEADQLVTKTKSGEDSRFIQLTLTNKGVAVRNSILTERQNLLQEAISILTQDERQILEGLIKKILGGLPFDRGACDRTCRLCDTSVCPDPDCPVQVQQLQESLSSSR